MIRCAEGLLRGASVVLSAAALPRVAPSAGTDDKEKKKKRRKRNRKKKEVDVQEHSAVDEEMAALGSLDPAPPGGSPGTGETGVVIDSYGAFVEELGPRWMGVDSGAGASEVGTSLSVAAVAHAAQAAVGTVAAGGPRAAAHRLPEDLAEVQQLSYGSGPEATRIFAQLLGKIGYKGKGSGGGKAGDFGGGRGGRREGHLVQTALSDPHDPAGCYVQSPSVLN